jgi:hypothetical protein
LTKILQKGALAWASVVNILAISQKHRERFKERESERVGLIAIARYGRTRGML